MSVLVFQNFTPPEGAEAYPGRVLLFDVVATGVDPVRAASIAATLDGTPLVRLSTTSIAGGYRARVWLPTRRGATHTVGLSADTVATAGVPTTDSYQFDADGYGFSCEGRADGHVDLPLASEAMLDGAIAAHGVAAEAMAALDGAALAAGAVTEVTAAVDGAVGEAIAMLDDSDALLFGLIGERFYSRAFACAVVTGERKTTPVHGAANVSSERPVGALPGAVNVGGTRPIASVPGATTTSRKRHERTLHSAIVTGRQRRQSLPGATNVEAPEAETTTVIDNPSTVYEDAGEA